MCIPIKYILAIKNLINMFIEIKTRFISLTLCKVNLFYFIVDLTDVNILPFPLGFLIPKEIE